MGLKEKINKLIGTRGSRDFVLLDTSIRESYLSPDHKGVVEHLYANCPYYEAVAPEVIKIEERGIEKFMLLLLQQPTYTISHVTAELHDTYKKIKKESDLFDQPKTSKGSGCKKIVQVLLQKLKLVIQQSKKSELEKKLDINDPRFDLLGKMVVLLSKRLGLKKDSQAYWGLKKGKHYVPFETDERLVGAALWLSVKRIPSTIATRDGDFLELLDQTPRWIGAGRFMPYNQLFRTGFVRMAPILWLGYKTNPYKEYRAKVSSLDFFPDDLPSSDRPTEVVEELGEALGDYLREFAKYS